MLLAADSKVLCIIRRLASPVASRKSSYASLCHQELVYIMYLLGYLLDCDHIWLVVNLSCDHSTILTIFLQLPLPVFGTTWLWLFRWSCDGDGYSISTALSLNPIPRLAMNTVIPCGTADLLLMAELSLSVRVECMSTDCQHNRHLYG